MNIIIEIDCILTIKGIHEDHKDHLNRDLILGAQELCRQDWKVLVKQVSREVNSAADALAKLMRDYPFGERIFHAISPSIDDQIQLDRCA